MLFKRLPFELVMINPGSKGDNGSRNPNYLAKNPGGTIPTIEEPATGFTLGEAHAIMTYLSRVHGWTMSIHQMSSSVPVLISICIIIIVMFGRRLLD